MRWPSRIKKDNRSVLREASRMAMEHGALLVLADTDRLKAMTQAPWRDKAREAKLIEGCYVLGVFRAMGGEDRYDVFVRMWDEAACAGAHLGRLPEERWVRAKENGRARGKS